MSDERIKKLTEYLLTDVDRANALIKLDVEDATAKINADGYDFTVDEIKEFGLGLQKVAANMSENGELSEEEAENVAGGILVETALITAGVSLFLGGVTLGYNIANNRGW